MRLNDEDQCATMSWNLLRSAYMISRAKMICGVKKSISNTLLGGFGPPFFYLLWVIAPESVAIESFARGDLRAEAWKIFPDFTPTC